MPSILKRLPVDVLGNQGSKEKATMHKRYIASG